MRQHDVRARLRHGLSVLPADLAAMVGGEVCGLMHERLQFPYLYQVMMDGDLAGARIIVAVRPAGVLARQRHATVYSFSPVRPRAARGQAGLDIHDPPCEQHLPQELLHRRDLRGLVRLPLSACPCPRPPLVRVRRRRAASSRSPEGQRPQRSAGACGPSCPHAPAPHPGARHRRARPAREALRENLCRSCTQRAFAHHAVAPVDQVIDRRRTPPLCTRGFGRGSEKGGEGGTIRSIASSGWRADSAPPSSLRE